VDVTPVMICVFVVMCCFMLVLLYYFYDRLGMPPTRGPRPPTQGPAQGPRGHSWFLDFLPFLPLTVPAPCLPGPAVYVIIGIFCLASSTGLYSCLAPFVRKLPFCTCR
jgi:signal peptide peptidase-like protein 2B